MTRVAVIGAGSWGTAVGAIVVQNAPTVLWAREPALARTINAEHENSTYLAGITLPAELRATSELADACADAYVVVFAVPSHGMLAKFMAGLKKGSGNRAGAPRTLIGMNVVP